MSTPEQGPEQRVWSGWNKVCAVGALVLSVIAIKVGQEENTHRQDVRRAFEAAFTGEDGCLSKTPYKTTDDFAFTLIERPGEEIFTVDPKNAEPIDLKVIERSSEQITFSPADYKAVGVLHDANCQGADSGY